MVPPSSEITISDSDASLKDTSVHWDFGSSSSARRIQFTSYFKGLRKMEPRRWQQASLLSDNAEESTVACYGCGIGAPLPLLEDTRLPPTQVSLQPIGSVAL